MAEGSSELKDRLVRGFGRSGKRRRFDSQAKRELVQACLQPGVSVARMALEHGLNANLLRKWISQHEQKHGGGGAANGMVGNTMAAFVPVVEISRASAAVHEARPVAGCAEVTESPQRPSLPSRLVAELPNGVTLKLECSGGETTLVTAMIETLGRCDVPARR